MPLAEAVEKAVDDCIRRGVLEEFLKKNRAEAIKVSIYEYDEERHMRQTKEEGFEEGYESGYESGLLEGRKMLKQTILLRRLGKSYEEISAQCGVTLEEIKDMLEGLE
jgi:flagellar biosynthesis/type III secretory pathway protein FliH